MNATRTPFIELYRHNGQVLLAADDSRFAFPELLPQDAGWALVEVDLELIPDTPCCNGFNCSCRGMVGPPEIQLLGGTLELSADAGPAPITRRRLTPEEARLVYGAYGDQLDEQALDE